ncbi:PIN domain-containing protein [Microbispora sp. NEAU-D428]|uniref:type II toxin-antitoxin system VapC family toxin n=1 Tax=Microbispora sitophila TaxID=2771537 RepID=UPI0018682B51|nr:PIN domain-containing protein [Microbispora sitophila]MBE3016208.1 PIN domain-containing protein [Microbispora sitophila]
MTGTSPILTRRSPTERSPRDPLRHGTLVAAFNRADKDHARCVRLRAQNWARLVVPSLAVTEICHLLSDPVRRGSPALFCAAVADDELRVIEVTPHDYRRMSELLAAYASLRPQAVDACVIALAERFDLRQVATLDQRDYLVVAPRHHPKGQRLTILPGD